MKSQSLYRELAQYYDLIYDNKDYKKEAREIKKIIDQYKQSSGDNLLEIGCGTGQHLQHLKNNFSCTGLDVNAGILKVARKKHPSISFRKASMVDFNLNKKFDIITCLFSSIGYVKTVPNLKKTINTFAKHLNSGGIAVIEPWFTKSTYHPGKVHMVTYDSPETKICRMTLLFVKNDVSVMDMHYLIGEKNKGVQHFVNRHELGLFDTNQTLKIMKEAGFTARYLKKGPWGDRGLLIGIKN